MKKFKQALLLLSALLITLSLSGCSSPRSSNPYDYSLQEAKKETLITQGEYMHIFEKYGYIALKINVYKSLPTVSEKSVYTVEVTSQFIPGIHLKQNNETSFENYYNKSGYVHVTVIPDCGVELKQKSYYPDCSVDGIVFSACPCSSNLDEIQWNYECPARFASPYTLTTNYCFGSDGIDVFNLKLDYKFNVKKVSQKTNYCSFNFTVNAEKGEITQTD